MTTSEITSAEALAERIIEIAEKRHGETWTYTFGLRALTKEQENLVAGDSLDNSWQSLDDVEPYELDGSCAIWFDVDEYDSAVKAINLVTLYGQGRKLAVITGSDSDWGNDEAETIIRNAEILEIL